MDNTTTSSARRRGTSTSAPSSVAVAGEDTTPGDYRSALTAAAVAIVEAMGGGPADAATPQRLQDAEAAIGRARSHLEGEARRSTVAACA